MTAKQIVIQKSRQMGMIDAIIEQANGATFMIITKEFCMSDTMPPTYFDFPSGGIAHLRASDEDHTLCGLSTNVYRPINYGHLERCLECQAVLANHQLKTPYWGSPIDNHGDK